jgi:hypothetical protein
VVTLDVQSPPRVHPAKAGLEQFERYVWIANAKALHVVGFTVGLRPRRHLPRKSRRERPLSLPLAGLSLHLA